MLYAISFSGRTYFKQQEDGVGREARAELLKKAEGAYLRSLQVSERLRGSIPDMEYWQMKTRLLLNIGVHCCLHHCSIEAKLILHFKHTQHINIYRVKKM